MTQRVALATLSIPPLGVALHKASQTIYYTLQLCQLDTSQKKDLPRTTLCLFQFSGDPITCADAARLSSPSPDPELTRMSNDAIPTSLIHTVYSWSSSTCRVSVGILTSFDAFAGPHQDLSCSWVLAHHEVPSTSCPGHDVTLRVLRWRWFAETFRVHQGWLGSKGMICSGYYSSAHCLRKSLWQLSQGVSETALLL